MNFIISKHLPDKGVSVPGLKTNRVDQKPPYIPIILLGLIILLGFSLYRIMVEDVEELLDPEELSKFRELQKAVDDKYTDCEQYFLLAATDGRRICRSCPQGISFVTLKKGEIFYIGHTCRGGDRHSEKFLDQHRVFRYINHRGSRDDCHRLELKLINGYQYLPQAQKPEVKLILPPYNIRKMN